MANQDEKIKTTETKPESKDLVIPPNWEGFPIVDLDEWFVAYASTDPWAAPECVPKVLGGVCKGHPSYSDGTPVTTSAIQDVCGRYIKTNHTVYRLLTPNPEWIATLKKPLDPENPVRFVNRLN